jgi:hypothetical protein
MGPILVFRYMMTKTVASLKLTVVLLAANLVASVVSFNIYTNHQQVYAQSIDSTGNTKSNSIVFTKSINLTNNTRDSLYMDR